MMLELSGGGGGAGASGAIWGIFLSLFSWIFLHRFALPPGLISAWQTQLFFGLILMLYLTFDSERVTKGGHLGGGLAGLFISFPLDSLRFGRGWRKVVAGCLLILFPAGVLAVTVFLAPQAQAIRKLNLSMLDSFEAARTHALVETYYGKLVRLLNQPAGNREIAEVEEALRSIDAAQTQVEDVLKAWSSQGPFPQPYENVRLTGIEMLESMKTILSQSRQILEHPGAKKTVGPALEKELQTIKRLERRW